MIKNIQSIRGINDYLPDDIIFWQYIEKILKQILFSYGYNEIRLPIIEKTILFKKSIGEMTDIIEKEMYTFIDKSGNNITLRPEGTTGCIRAGIENNLLYKKKQRFWYYGPMFRYERPQKYRYRQFYQLGIEVFGYLEPNIDAEIIMLNSKFWRKLGINESLLLEINSIGSLEIRDIYLKKLKQFLLKNEHYLDDDCRRRMNNNPIRIFDTKNLKVKLLLKDAPIIIDYLDNNSRNHFYKLCKLLDLVGIKYKINPYLVRGLDYYNDTVFEWVTNNFNSHNTICGGGRYDNLVKKLGGYNTPAIGCAIGLERLIFLIKMVNPNFNILKKVDVFLLVIGNDTIYSTAILLANELREEFSFLKLIVHYSNINCETKIIKANKNKSNILMILNEYKSPKQIFIKNLFTGYQELVLQTNVINRLAYFLKFK